LFGVYLCPTTALCRNEGELIKTDCIGRILVSSENREKLLDTFESSGISGQQFADHCGVKYSTFATWVQKRRRQRNEYPAEHAAAPKNLFLLHSNAPPKTLNRAIEVLIYQFTLVRKQGIARFW
jgi:hypothetical protein